MSQFKIRSLKFNYFMNLILTGSSLVFPLITFPLVSRALQADIYGLCSWAISIANWFSLFAMLGVNRYGIRLVAQHRDDPRMLAKVSQELLAATLITTSVSFTLFILSIALIPDFRENAVLLLINGGTVLFNTLGVSWFFQGIEQYAYITIRGVLIKIACFLGVVILVHSPSDYLTYAALIVLSSAIANIVNLIYMFRIVNSQTCKKKHAIKELFMGVKIIFKSSFKHFKSLLVFFSITAAISVYTTLDTIMLGLLSSSTEVGYYTAAGNIKVALVGLVSALTGVLLPRASHLIYQNKIYEFLSLIRKCTFFVLLLAIPISLIMAIEATPIITWYAGDSFAPAGPTISIMSLAIIPISLSMIFCDAILVPLGKEKICGKIYCVAAGINFSTNLLLIPLFGSIGTAISTLIVECFITIVEWYFVRKYIAIKSNA